MKAASRSVVREAENYTRSYAIITSRWSRTKRFRFFGHGMRLMVSDVHHALASYQIRRWIRASHASNFKRVRHYQ
jgi:hypothetical protein